MASDSALPSAVRGGSDFDAGAASRLERYDPQFSARTVITAKQGWAFSVLALFLAACFVVAPLATGSLLGQILAGWFLANAAFRGLLFAAGATKPCVPFVPLLEAGDARLPIYTVLVPLYREAVVLPGLLRALDALDYPRERLDIKLIVEEDDGETRGGLDGLALAPEYEIVVVPPGTPRTKPRACNHALPLSRGELLVIYDAEDRPEPQQLRKAAALFASMGLDIACLQARLNFFNARENILTRLFAGDYALWFDYLLPGLERFGIPMPLGGTSNHFRFEALWAIHGWDPFNVTEDADIGIRLARLGYRVRTFGSTTFEEAPTELGNWIRQRSRWQKGYMQTWLVHMRNPLQLWRNAGPLGFIGFQLFIGGTFVSAFLNPILWAIMLVIFLCNLPLQHTAHVCYACLFLGNAFYVLLAVLGLWRRRWFALMPFGALVPFYWAMASIAFYRAFAQLVSRPFHWEKTRHGTSRFAALP
ncbi:MAG TPA: glycosyltransferase [Rhizomicrobium sp.]